MRKNDMGLNISKGNMYEWVTHTWNAIKGKCPHDCSYCYMKLWGELNPSRLDEKEFKTDLGKRNFIFVGSSIDMFANDIPELWIDATLEHCRKYYANDYLFQSKNPARFFAFGYPENTVFCTTIESNRWYPEIMRNSPKPQDRAVAMNKLSGYKRYVTIEPVLDFDMNDMVKLIKTCKPKQVNIGADSMGHKMPEPSADKLLELIGRLSEFTTIHNKKNLKRLIN